MSPDDIIRAEIRPGEQILWSGRPRQGIVVHLVDSWSFVGGTFLAAMAGMTALQPEVSNRWVGILLLGPIALYAVVGRFVIDAWQRSRTHYGITSDRILIVVDFPNHRVQSLFYNAIANVSIVSDRSGRGRIWFVTTSTPSPWAFPSGAPGWHLVPHFEIEAEVQQVHDLIIDARREHMRRPIGIDSLP